MAAFTSTDLKNVNCAIKELVDGKRVVAVTISGPAGDKVTQYERTNLEDLLALRDRIIAEISAAETDSTKRRSRIFRTRHAKGL